ncbi:MAG: hypothetical protein FWC19_03985 [Treponema sp.]|nr:hypothetical protein [Treponema sp.]
MTRGILIAGNDSSLTRAVEAEVTSRVEQYTAAFIPNRFSGITASPVPAKEKRLPLDWNPSSPISARTLVLAAENRLETIDEAILICSPPVIICGASDLPLSDVEIMVNDHIKGWFFLIKELTAIFKNRKQGLLALVYPGNNARIKKGSSDILGSSALASFRALTKNLLAAAASEPYTTTGFSGSGNEAAFASFILKKIDEADKSSNGKLHKFGRFSFFKN